MTWSLQIVLSVCDHIFAECDTNEEKVTCYSHQSGHMMMMQLLDFFPLTKETRNIQEFTVNPPLVIKIEFGGFSQIINAS